MPNKYAGTCYRCGETVEAGMGVFEKVSKVQADKWPNSQLKERWLIQHHNCAKQWKHTAQHFVFNDLRKEKQ